MMHSSLRVRGKLTQMCSVSLATSTSFWRTIKKVSLHVLHKELGLIQHLGKLKSSFYSGTSGNLVPSPIGLSSQLLHAFLSLYYNTNHNNLKVL